MHVGMADLIFPSDVLYYHCDRDCFCLQGMSNHPGRVFTICRDNTKDASLPSLYIVIIINFDTKDYPILLQIKARELMLSAERSYHVQVVSRKSDIDFKYRYRGPHVHLIRASTCTTQFVTRILGDAKTPGTRPLQLSAPIRGALEFST